MDADRTCIPDLQTLIIGLESRHDYLRLQAGLVAERSFGRSVHLEKAARSIGFGWSVQCKQTLNRHFFGIERCMHVVFAGKLHASTCLNETLGHLRIQSQLCLLVCHAEVCFDPRDTRLTYLKLRDLDCSG